MKGATDWRNYQSWHELLEALCVEQGHLDNMALAEMLCSANGNTSQTAFETAAKNLRNWRDGLHLPQRRNFIILTKALKIDRQQGLRERWVELYANARAESAAETVQSRPTDPSASISWPQRNWWLAGAAAFLALLGLGIYSLQSLPALVDAKDEEFEGIQAEYVRSVSAKIGDAVIIHGARGNECGAAPTWDVAKEFLPTLVTGKLLDGGLGTRYSRQCGGRVPARAILFKAEKAGSEQVSLYGDEVVIRVTQ